jgi:hypothetical protein
VRPAEGVEWGIDALTAHNSYIRGMGKIVNPDSWYFQVKCHFCGRDFAVAEDPSHGSKAFDREAAHLECPNCQAFDHYSLDEIRTGPSRYNQ